MCALSFRPISERAAINALYPRLNWLLPIVLWKIAVLLQSLLPCYDTLINLFIQGKTASSFLQDLGVALDQGCLRSFTLAMFGFRLSGISEVMAVDI